MGWTCASYVVTGWGGGEVPNKAEMSTGLSPLPGNQLQVHIPQEGGLYLGSGEHRCACVPRWFCLFKVSQKGMAVFSVLG